MAWKQYDSDQSISVLKGITKKDSSLEERCRDLLTAAKDSQRFVAHIQNLVNQGGGKLHDGDTAELEKLKELNENEFKNLSWEGAHAGLWDAMHNVQPIEACRPGLWLYLTLNAIENGIIKPHFLAYNPKKSSDSGLAQIETALKSNDAGEKTPLYLKCSRAVLRHMFGAISDRGAKAVFTDIPFAKMWWQRHIAEEISRGEANIPADKMAEFFSDNAGIYGELTMRMSSSLTVIGDKQVRDGLMHFCFHAYKDEAKRPQSFDPTSDNFKKLVKRLGVMLAWRAMGAMSVSENSKEIYSCADDIINLE